MKVVKAYQAVPQYSLNLLLAKILTLNLIWTKCLVVFERSKNPRFLIELHNFPKCTVVHYEAKIVVIWRINYLIQTDQTLVHNLLHDLDFA